jgi:hypothetical protein
MNTMKPFLWSSTPTLSERNVSAMSRIANILRSGAWQLTTTEGLNPTQGAALALQFHTGTNGVRMEPWLIGHTLELRKARIDINQLRHAGLTEVADKAIAGQHAYPMASPRRPHLAAPKLYNLIIKPENNHANFSL